jgi:hypothetical protein
VGAAAGKTSGANLSPARVRAGGRGRAPADRAGRATGSPGTHRRGRNGSAVERVIAALRAADRVQDVDAGALALVRTTGAALDAAAGAYDVAVLARVHLSAIGYLLAGHAAERDDELDRFLASLRAPALGDGSQS